MRKVCHPDFPQYLVRDDGFVERTVDSPRASKAGDFLSGRVLVSGYRQFKLRDGAGKPCFVRANRLVAEAFHGPAPTPRHHSAHRNGDRLDNRPENVYWATAKQNAADKAAHGTTARGAAIGAAQLDDGTVAEIRKTFDGQRGTITRLANQYGVSRQAIARVLSRETWDHVETETAKPTTIWASATPDEKLALVKFYAEAGRSTKYAAEKMGAGRDAVMHFARKVGIKFRGWQRKVERSALYRASKAGAEQ